MKLIFVLIIISILTIKNVFSLKFNYISSNGSIHSYNESIIEVPKETVALLIYENNVNKTGWANLELKTYDNFPYDVQSYMGGVLEGYITGQLIHMNYRNNIEDICNKKQTICQLIKEFKENNTEFVDNMIDKHKSDDYWHQLKLIYKQINGLEVGYDLWKDENNVKNTTERQYMSEIFWLNLLPETFDLQNILGLKSKTKEFTDHCSAIVKPLADGSDLYVSHNTWSGYKSMLRVMKKYVFPFKTLQSNHTKLMAGHSVSFPSYPGVINSADDYYIMSSGLVVQETTNENHNQSLYGDIRADKILFETFRNVLANRLANSGKEWTDLFGPYNSGTYNNQFMIVDYKLFKKGTKLVDLPNNLLWITEQMPSIIHSADVTPVLRQQGYWASYNVPYFKDIYQLSGTKDLLQKTGPLYSYNQTARALIFNRDHSKVTDLKTLYSLMRYNDFQNDPLSQCKLYNRTCSPPYSGGLTIAARIDLNDKSGVYPPDVWKRLAIGATDAKMTNASMVSQLEMLAVSGPTDQQQPSFRWSTSDFKDKHYGHPDVFNFKPIFVKWFPNNWETVQDF